MFSILIPTYNNLEYLKLCIKSLEKNSYFKNQIICHVNIGEDGTIEYLESKQIDYTHTSYNSGICEGINKAAKIAKFDYYLYVHDDFYFCPDWDTILLKEVKNIGHNYFYLSGTMMNQGQIKFNCGNAPNDFDENKFLNEYKNHNFYNFQGSTWAPSLVHKEIWGKVRGLSEEYFPGTGSDPDFNMKLWKIGVRIFKGINDFKVYHFGSIVTRKYKGDSKIITESGSKGGKIFLLKWGMTIKFFKKFIMKSDTKFNGELKDPIRNFNFYINLFITKINFFYVKYFYKIKI